MEWKERVGQKRDGILQNRTSSLIGRNGLAHGRVILVETRETGRKSQVGASAVTISLFNALRTKWSWATLKGWEGMGREELTLDGRVPLGGQRRRGLGLPAESWSGSSPVARHRGRQPPTGGVCVITAWTQHNRTHICRMIS